MSVMFRATRMLRADVAGTMKSMGQAAKPDAMKGPNPQQDTLLKRGAKKDPELYVRGLGQG